MDSRILFLLPYPLQSAPSQRFRIELFFPELEKSRITYDVSSFMDMETWNILYRGGGAISKLWGVLKGFSRRWFTVLFRCWRYQYVFIHREAAPIGPPVFEWILARLFGKKIIYDFDDAIWMSDSTVENRFVRWIKCRWKIKYICRWSYKISAGNLFLHNYAQQFNSNVTIIPTCVDTDLHHNKIKDHKEGHLTIGWTGSHSTLKYLEIILPAIASLQQEFNFTFLIISNKPPAFELKNLKFVKWNEKSEVDDLLHMDIGVMPLPDNLWSEGKCGFKLVQYLSLGIPAVASMAGVNKKIIEQGVNGFLCENVSEWKCALQKLLTDSMLRKSMGVEGRRKIGQEYSIRSQKTKFIELFS